MLGLLSGFILGYIIEDKFIKFNTIDEYKKEISFSSKIDTNKDLSLIHIFPRNNNEGFINNNNTFITDLYCRNICKYNICRTSVEYIKYILEGIFSSNTITYSIFNNTIYNGRICNW